HWHRHIEQMSGGAASVRFRHPMLRGLGPRVYAFRGHLCVYCRYVTRNLPRGDLVVIYWRSLSTGPLRLWRWLPFRSGSCSLGRGPPQGARAVAERAIEWPISARDCWYCRPHDGSGHCNPNPSEGSWAFSTAVQCRVHASDFERAVV